MEGPPGEQFPKRTRQLLDRAVERVLERLRVAQESRQAQEGSREDATENAVDREDSSQKNARAAGGFPSAASGYGLPSAVAIEDFILQSMVGRARELHRRIGELGISGSVIEETVAARVRWNMKQPSLPPGQAKLVDEILELLQDPRLSSWQAHELQRAFFSG
jgi:hypothetical protein